MNQLSISQPSYQSIIDKRFGLSIITVIVEKICNLTNEVHLTLRVEAYVQPIPHHMIYPMRTAVGRQS